jgi:diadenosine tetraphosphate (Ap4A) HIT family hydrolase
MLLAFRKSLLPLRASFVRSMSSEESRAVAMKESEGMKTIFDKIISKEIPSTVVFEDDKCLAFRDISPQAPVHIVLVPKDRGSLTRLIHAQETHKSILGHMMVTAAHIARTEKLDDGFRIVINDGPAGCQSVYHIHVHILGGRTMNWPPG